MNCIDIRLDRKNLDGATEALSFAKKKIASPAWQVPQLTRVPVFDPRATAYSPALQ